MIDDHWLFCARDIPCGNGIRNVLPNALGAVEISYLFSCVMSDSNHNAVVQKVHTTGAPFLSLVAIATGQFFAEILQNALIIGVDFALAAILYDWPAVRRHSLPGAAAHHYRVDTRGDLVCIRA